MTRYPYIEIVRLPDLDTVFGEEDQYLPQWKARIVGGNGEKVWYTETYNSKESCREAIEIAAEVFAEWINFQALREVDER